MAKTAPGTRDVVREGSPRRPAGPQCLLHPAHPTALHRHLLLGSCPSQHLDDVREAAEGCWPSPSVPRALVLILILSNIPGRRQGASRPASLLPRCARGGGMRRPWPAVTKAPRGRTGWPADETVASPTEAFSKIIKGKKTLRKKKITYRKRSRFIIGMCKYQFK